MQIVELSPAHDMASFKCGNWELDRYLKKFALANGREGYGTTFVALTEESKVAAYYTLSNGNVSVEVVPEDDLAGLPRYPVPSVLLAKLAVHRDYQGKGIRRAMLVSVYRKFMAIQRISAARFLEVHAADETAKAFYLARGFRPLLQDPLHLYMPLQIVEVLSGEKLTDDST